VLRASSSSRWCMTTSSVVSAFTCVQWHASGESHNMAQQRQENPRGGGGASGGGTSPCGEAVEVAPECVFEGR
jgi:hypothetical protein